jgi:hypothetical protein
MSKSNAFLRANVTIKLSQRCRGRGKKWRGTRSDLCASARKLMVNSVVSAVAIIVVPGGLGGRSFDTGEHSPADLKLVESSRF